MYDDRLVKIKNIDKMSKGVGKDVARNMGIRLRDFKHFIKPREIKSIIVQYAIEKDDGLYISPLILEKIFTTVNSWVIGIQMCKLAVENKMEVYWDEEQNCAVFENKE